MRKQRDKTVKMLGFLFELTVHSERVWFPEIIIHTQTVSEVRSHEH
jgi:hypothetical protein